MRFQRFASLATTIITILTADAAFGLDREHLKPIAHSTTAKFTLSIQSDQFDFVGQGKTYRYSEADADIGVNPIEGSLGTTSVLGLQVRGKAGKSNDVWNITIKTKLDDLLSTGTYSPVVNAADSKTGPGLAVQFATLLNGEVTGQRYCGLLTGHFTITTIALDCFTLDGVLSTHLKQLVMTFEQHCDDGKPALRGQLSYLDTGGVQCDSGGGSGDGSGTPTPVPQPTLPTPVVVLSDELRANPILMGNAVSTTVLFSTFVPDTATGDVTLSASSDADNLLVSINPPVITSRGTIDAVATISTTATTLAGNHAVTITATDAAGAASAATVFVTVICDPPFILGIDQPKGSTVSLGRPANLSVKASGSGPLTYQWFTGSTGLVNFPLAGGTSSTFTTSALNDTTSYWVRVTNPCGSVNSQTATITVSPSKSTTNPRR